MTGHSIPSRAAVQLPPEWRREGMVVVADSMTGELLGCMGRETWQEQSADEDDQEPTCVYCRGSGLSPYSIRDVACRHCGGQG